MHSPVPKIAVVIPFYQRTAGLLSRAVLSALNQQGAHDLQIIVVDDGSPISARAELKAIPAECQSKVVLHEVRNGGVGRARNLGLNLVGPDVDFIAFLDSDDEWVPDHLSTALSALGSDADFYFADGIREDWSTTAFTRCTTFHPADHHLIDPVRENYEFVGDAFVQVLRNNMIGTSVVVYRRAVGSDIRFSEDLTNSGEDILFWLDLLKRSRKVVFSARLRCRYYSGVNICYGARWGTTQCIRATVNDLTMLSRVLARFTLDERTETRVRAQQQEMAENVGEQVLHRLLRGDVFALKWIMSVLSQSSKSATAVTGLSRALAKKLRLYRRA